MIVEKLVRYCILSYNQEKYIGSCVKSVLNQTYSNLEIIISDDNSTDKSWDIIQNISKSYNGKHKIKTFKNLNNLGLAQHYSKIISEIVLGEYFIFLGCDDLCSINHVKVAMNYVSRFPNIMQIDFSAEIIDENSNIIGKDQIEVDIKKFTLDHYLDIEMIRSFAPGRIIKKELFTNFGPINNNCPTEDSVMVMRSLFNGGFLRVNDLLIKYRKHSSSLSSVSALKKMNNELIINQYLIDLNLFFSNGFIQSDLYQKIIYRILLQLNLRNLININNNFKSMILHICYRFIYLFQTLLIKK